MILGFRYSLELDSVRRLLGLNFQLDSKCLECDLESRWLMFQHLDEDGIPFNEENIEPIGFCLQHFESLYNEQYEKYKNTTGCKN